jgi:hypothetical protein
MKYKQYLMKVNKLYKDRNKTPPEDLIKKMKKAGITPYVPGSDNKKSEDNKNKPVNNKPIEMEEIVVTASKPKPKKRKFKRTMSGFKPIKDKFTKKKGMI